ncbi:MAG: hypothetical protein QW289_02220 [Sulfolobales archaeon]
MEPEMSTERSGPSVGLGSLLRLTTSAALTALSLVLFLFKFPYPPAPFLKFDGMGIPLAVLALYSLRALLAVQPVVYVGLQVLGADFIGAGMKVTAELSTLIPIALSYRQFCLRRECRRMYPLVIAFGILGRVTTMSLLNYLIAPHWMVMAYGWTFEKAYTATIALIPHIAVFNLVAASYVGVLALEVSRVVSKALGAEMRKTV